MRERQRQRETEIQNQRQRDRDSDSNRQTEGQRQKKQRRKDRESSLLSRLKPIIHTRSSWRGFFKTPYKLQLINRNMLSLEAKSLRHILVKSLTR